MENMDVECYGVPLDKSNSQVCLRFWLCQIPGFVLDLESEHGQSDMIVNIGSWSMVIADNTGLLENKSHCHMHQILCILLSDHGFGLNGHLHHLHHRRAADERIRRGKTVLHHHHSFLQHLTMNDFVSNTRWNTLCCSTALRSLTSSQSTSSPLSTSSAGFAVQGSSNSWRWFDCADTFIYIWMEIELLMLFSTNKTDTFDLLAFVSMLWYSSRPIWT